MYYVNVYQAVYCQFFAASHGVLEWRRRGGSLEMPAGGCFRLFLGLHYIFEKPKREPAKRATSEERYIQLARTPETLLGQNNRTLRTFVGHRTQLIIPVVAGQWGR